MKMANIVTYCHGPVTRKDNHFRRPKWKDEFKNTFVDNIRLCDIDIIHSEIAVLSLMEQIKQSDIDDIYILIKNLMHESAKACGSIATVLKGNTPTKLNKRSHFNSWWNSDCESSRKNSIWHGKLI